MKYLSNLLISAILFVMTLTVLSCKKEMEAPFMNNAEIVDADTRLTPCLPNDPCNCPGGFFFHIDGIANPNGNCFGCMYFKSTQLPAGFTLGNSPQFPVAVKIDWKYDSLLCDSTRINISRISLRQ